MSMSFFVNEEALLLFVFLIVAVLKVSQQIDAQQKISYSWLKIKLVGTFVGGKHSTFLACENPKLEQRINWIAFREIRSNAHARCGCQGDSWTSVESEARGRLTRRTREESDVQFPVAQDLSTASEWPPFKKKSFSIYTWTLLLPLSRITITSLGDIMAGRHKVYWSCTCNAILSRQTKDARESLLSEEEQAELDTSLWDLSTVTGLWWSVLSLRDV